MKKKTETQKFVESMGFKKETGTFYRHENIGLIDIYQKTKSDIAMTIYKNGQFFIKARFKNLMGIV